MNRTIPWAAPSLLMLIACGHPATSEECDAIFRKSAELELRSQSVTDPAEIDRRVAEARASKPDLLDDCVGKRITDEAMQCVKSATTSEAFDACLQ